MQSSVSRLQVMLTQRDVIMARNLRRDCRSGRIVAVVGMAQAKLPIPEGDAYGKFVKSWIENRPQC